ncbi:hypothetical protein HO133_005003 [Letharia lupina]|uniref:Uncharacterized protein n=1 Tax=Letharia lupina TaxID=560253 RepID=A0A8H6C8Z0_9LECA|nr:uncharacterized protein HO133_005003 [Letharia lupina]KAF6219178.1 hypothetical protein HO133_005003 [Letharia lupina]
MDTSAATKFHAGLVKCSKLTATDDILTAIAEDHWAGPTGCNQSLSSNKTPRRTAGQKAKDPKLDDILTAIAEDSWASLTSSDQYENGPRITKRRIPWEA